MDAQSATEIRILVVDDDAGTLLALKGILAPLGVTVVTAGSGNEALQALQQDFAAILLDLNMPGMDGFETAALIRKSERARTTPILFLTASSWTAEDIAKAYLVGAMDFMTVPITPTILRSKVAAFVELARGSVQLANLNKQLEAQVDEVARVNARLAHLATHDFLTEALNRRGLDEAMVPMMARAQRAGREETGTERRGRDVWATIAMLDFDRFKAINDSFGHAAGDQVLRQAVDVMRSSLRATDLLARVGGDEFVILMPETDLAAGTVVARTIRAALAQASFALSSGERVDLRASLGVVALTSEHTTVDHIYALVDRQLYASKRGDGGPVAAPRRPLEHARKSTTRRSPPGSPG